MEPAIEAGSRVTVHEARLYFPGDVVVARRGNRFEAHRFLGYRPSRFGFVALTQADKVSSIDTAIPTKNVLGRIDKHVRFQDRGIAVIRYARAVKNWLINP